MDSIEKEAFLNHPTRQRVIIPNGMRRMERHAFKNCKSIVNIFIYISVGTVEGDAFQGCKKLKIVTERDAPVLQKVLKSGRFSRIPVVVRA